MKKLKAVIFIQLLTFTINLHSVFAESLSSPTYKYSIDLPEGFSLVNKSSDNKSYLFSNKDFDILAAITIYNSNIYKTPQKALENFLKKNNAIFETELVHWRKQNAAIAQFTMTVSGYEISGYAESAFLSDKKNIIIFASWTFSQQSEANGALIISALDSLCIDRSSSLESGIFTSYLYPSQNKLIDFEVEIDGIKIASKIDSTAQESSDYLIEREYNVLCHYASSPKWKDAWCRYYKMIYRDSTKKLQRLAFDIYNTLSPLCDDETDLAQKLLFWTQNFTYEREKTSSDFASLPSIVLGGGSDCDSRSMLLAVLLNQMNMDSIIFVSAQYSHAITGLVSLHPGISINVNGKKYLTGETTAKGLTWGKISQDMSDISKWIPVEFN